MKFCDHCQTPAACKAHEECLTPPATGPLIARRSAATCSALDAARTLARTAPTKTMTRAVAMSAMLDHCRVGEDVDQAASRILADAFDNVTADLKTLLHVAEINRLGSHGTVVRMAEKYTPNVQADLSATVEPASRKDVIAG